MTDEINRSLEQLPTVKAPSLCQGLCMTYAWPASCIKMCLCCCVWLPPDSTKIVKIILFALVFPFTLIFIVLGLFIGLFTDLIMLIVYLFTCGHCCHSEHCNFLIMYGNRFACKSYSTKKLCMQEAISIIICCLQCLFF